MFFKISVFNIPKEKNDWKVLEAQKQVLINGSLT